MSETEYEHVPSAWAEFLKNHILGYIKRNKKFSGENISNDIYYKNMTILYNASLHGHHVERSVIVWLKTYGLESYRTNSMWNIDRVAKVFEVFQAPPHEWANYDWQCIVPYNL